MSALENTLYNILPQETSAKPDFQPLYLTYAKSPESRGNDNHSASGLCSTLDAGVVTTLYTWYLVYPAGIHCHLKQSPAMFLGDEILCFEKEL